MSRNRTYNPSILGLATRTCRAWTRASASTSCRRSAVGQQKAFVSGSGATRRSSTSPSLDVFYRVHAVAQRLADDQHGLLRDRSRRPAGQPHALQSVLPREARLLPQRRRSLRVRPHQQQRLQRQQRGDVAAEPRERPAVLLAPHRLEPLGNAGRHRVRRQAQRPRRALERRLARGAPGRVRAAGQPGYVEAQDSFVGRVSANVLEESNVGIIVTDGDPQLEHRQQRRRRRLPLPEHAHPGRPRARGGRVVSAVRHPGPRGRRGCVRVGVSMPNTRAGAAAFGQGARAQLQSRARLRQPHRRPRHRVDAGYTRSSRATRCSACSPASTRSGSTCSTAAASERASRLQALELETHTRDVVRVATSPTRSTSTYPFACTSIHRSGGQRDDRSRRVPFDEASIASGR